MSTYDFFLQEIKKMPTIDVHEHLINDPLRKKRFTDYLALVFSNYTYVNAISAGMPVSDYEYLIRPGGDLEKKYHQFAQFAPYIQATTAFRCIDRAFHCLYGISILSPDFEEVNRRFCFHNQPGETYRVIAKNTSIETVINDVYDTSMQNTDYTVDSRYMRPSIRCDKYILFDRYWDALEEEHNCTFSSLDALCTVFGGFVDRMVREFHAVSLKIAVAYDRSLTFHPCPQDDAQRAFDRVLSAKSKKAPWPEDDVKLVQDYMAHQLIRHATNHGIPVQIHPAFQDRNDNIPARGDPDQLVPLFSLYPDTRFVLFHTAYPKGRMAGVLAKMFPNVFLDFSWVHILSSFYARAMLLEYIEVVPTNKIALFGGDFFHIEGAYGHLLFAQENLAAVASSLVESHTFSEQQMLSLCQLLLYQNPKTLYHL